MNLIETDVIKKTAIGKYIVDLNSLQIKDSGEVCWSFQSNWPLQELIAFL